MAGAAGACRRAWLVVFRCPVEFCRPVVFCPLGEPDWLDGRAELDCVVELTELLGELLGELLALFVLPGGGHGGFRC